MQNREYLAAFDDAVADGVDVIMIQMGADSGIRFDEDPMLIGAFHAMKKGILTTQSAGNEGPGPATLSDFAPLLVAASTIDRHIIDKVVLANGKTLVGNSVNTFASNGTSFPLIYGKDAATKNCTQLDAGLCREGCLDSDSVKGKIVVCDAEYGDYMAYQANAFGSLIHENDRTAFNVPLIPSTVLMDEDHDAVKSYMNSTRNPRANILKSEVIKDPSAPTVASYSSRGPNRFFPDIIKPDISAPGSEILAAYSPIASISEYDEDTRRVKYNLLSGTTMSSPHAAGAAAYVKAFHPDWSPAAIKSSLMTTAWTMNNTNNSTGEFAYGSGHINPVEAVNPGLVYEASEEDYIKLLCTVFDEGKVRLISGDNSTCPEGSEKGYARDLNYPSMGAKVAEMEPFTVNFHRRVNNVGLPNSTYKARISSNSKVDIKVVPEVLSFESLNEERTFDVIVTGSGLPDQSQVSGSLVWTDGVHSVRSPIVVYVFNVK